MGSDTLEQESRKGPNATEQVRQYWPQAFSHLAHLINQADGSGRCGFSFNFRGDGDWLAIARSSGSDGGPIVCFGNSDTFLGAMARLNAAVAAGAWKPDKLAGK